MSEYPETPTGGYVRGRGLCTACGLRAWKWRRKHDNAQLELRCVGCDSEHRDTALKRDRVGYIGVPGCYAPVTGTDEELERMGATFEPDPDRTEAESRKHEGT